jgi:hypothetical protein
MRMLELEIVKEQGGKEENRHVTSPLKKGLSDKSS